MTTETKVEAVAWIPRDRFERLIDGWSATCYSRAWKDADKAQVIDAVPLVPASAITALEGEVERLRAIEAAARTYYREYCQDEAGDELLNDGRGMWTGATAKQISDAAALRDALTKESP